MYGIRIVIYSNRLHQSNLRTEKETLRPRCLVTNVPPKHRAEAKRNTGSHITKKKKQFDSMSDSGGKKDEILKQKLLGVMEEAGLSLTDATVQAMYDMAAREKSTKSTKASSTPSATQEVNSLSTTHVEPQPNDDSKEGGSDNKIETEQAEHATKSARPETRSATLESSPLSTVEKKPSGLTPDSNLESKMDSPEEEANEKEKKADSRSPIEPQPDVVKRKDGATSTSSRDKKRDDTGDEEHKTHLPNVMKSNKRKRLVVEKERATSTSSRKKERNVKRKKRYVEEDDEDGAEVTVTGSRKSVEVYQEDFDDDLVDDEGHRSLEKKGNCTVIQQANTKLAVEFGHSAVGPANLETVYSKEKCDDSMKTPPHLNVLTSLPCQTELMGGSTHAEGALQELEHPRYDGVKDELVLPSKDNRIILLKLQTIRIARLKATELTSVSNI